MLLQSLCMVWPVTGPISVICRDEKETLACSATEGLLAKFSGYFGVSMVSKAQHAPRHPST